MVHIKEPLFVFQALHSGYSVDEIHALTDIDKWFLYKLQNIINLENKIKKYAE